MADENVVGGYAVRQGGLRLAVRVVQRDGDIDRPQRERQQADILEGAADCACLGCLQPFLKERGERMAVNDLAAGHIGHHHLPVALQRELRQVVPPTGPPGQGRQPAHADSNVRGVTGKDIVDPQRTVGKTGIEILRARHRSKQSQQQSENFFLIKKQASDTASATD